MKKLLSLLCFLSCLCVQPSAAQGQAVDVSQHKVTVYDPELQRPVEGVTVWGGGVSDTTNVFGEAHVAQGVDTLMLGKAGYITLRIPSRWMADTIPMLRDAFGIGEVVVYGTDGRTRFQDVVSGWTKEQRVEYELRHPITGISFDAAALLSRRQRRERKQRRRLEKLFRRMDAEGTNPFVQSYRRALEQAESSE